MVKKKKAKEPEFLTPFGARCIVEPHDPHIQETKSGLLLAKDLEFHPVTGHVVAAGTGPWKNDNHPEVGDAIIYGRMRGKIHQYLGKEYLILDEEHIYAKYPNAEIPTDLN